MVKYLARRVKEREVIAVTEEVKTIHNVLGT